MQQTILLSIILSFSNTYSPALSQYALSTTTIDRA